MLGKSKQNQKGKDNRRMGMESCYITGKDCDSLRRLVERLEGETRQEQGEELKSNYPRNTTFGPIPEGREH